MIKLLLKVVGVYGVFFVISIFLAAAMLYVFPVQSVVTKVLIGYVFGLVGCIPSVIFSMRIVYQTESL